MCEVLLRVADKIGADPYLDAKCLKRGDIVVVCADGWAWGADELVNPFWRILKLPNVTVAQAEGFLGREFDTDPAKPSRVLRRRAFGVDLASVTIPAGLKAWLLDDTRAAPTRTTNFTPAQFLALKQAKAPLLDPNVIG